MCTLGDTFQAKGDKIIGDIDGVKIYIDDLLVFIKDRLSKTIEQPSIIFSRLRAVGLKLNAPKCSFGLKEIPYLGYVITQDGIKTDQRKLRGIIDIRRPTT